MAIEIKILIAYITDSKTFFSLRIRNFIRMGRMYEQT